jgi:membrane-associated HD superfamily phosphohydrolase
MINLMIIDNVTILSSLFLCVIRQSYIDEIVELLLFDVIFLALFSYLLENERLSGNIASDTEHDFGTIAMGYCAMMIYSVALVFLPEFSRPVMIIALIMELLSDPVIAIAAGIYMTSVICLVADAPSLEYMMYVMLILAGAVIVNSMERDTSDSRNITSRLILIFSVNVAFAVVFPYFLYREPSYLYPVYGVVTGLFSDIFMAFFFRKMAHNKKNEITDKLSDILDEQYALAKELKEFSKAEYIHARRVSKVASSCARYVNADDELAAAAGMYYRIGILEGEPLSDTGERIARGACFPTAVTKIISEYGGEHELPSNAESAIVHMVDGLIKKMEVLSEESTGSKWNQDMMIYQTLNDFSAQGIYDKSGLTMNQFLKIRECLLNTDELL